MATETEDENVISLRKLIYSPIENPFFSPTTIETKKKTIRTSAKPTTLYNNENQAVAVSFIHTVEEKDEEEFVKVFADGVKASFDLNRTSFRVFQAILQAYQKEKMTGGFQDSVSLFWFDEGLNGAKLDMSEKTFHRGLKTLISKKFLSPKIPNQYWVNPTLFFKGSRVAFIRELRKKISSPSIENFDKITGEIE